MANIFKLAENLLNNLDQSAQSSIQNAISKTPNSQTKNENIKQYKNVKNKTSNNLPPLPSKATASLSSISASSSFNNLKQNDSSSSLYNLNTDSNRASSKLIVNKEEELINFLNSSETIDINFNKRDSIRSAITDNSGNIFA